MSKRITVQDGNLVVADTTDPYVTIGDTVVTTDAATLTFAEPITDYWTITRAGGASDFVTEGFVEGDVITISGSASNDGTYTIGEFGVSATVIEVAPYSALVLAEGPVAATLTATRRNVDLTDQANIRIFDRTNTYHTEISQSQAWLDIRGRSGGGGLYHYGGGLIGVFDWTDGVSNPPVDATDTAYATVGGYSGDQWQLWEVGTYSVGDMDLTVHNYVPDAAVGVWVADITDSFYRRVFEGDYATGAHLYWPTTNAIALSTDVAGVYSPLGSVYLEEKGTPGGDTAARGQLWVRDDNPQTLMFTDGDSTDFAVAGSGVASVLSTGTPADNQVAVWTATSNTLEGDANFTWTGTTLAIAGAGAQLLLPLENDDATPTLAFGDGDTGFYEVSDDTIGVSVAGTQRYAYNSTAYASVTSGGFYLDQTATSATNPAHSFQSDTDTGIGSAAADQLSLISGGVEILRLVETGVATTDQVIIGPAGIIGTFGTPALAFGDGDTGFYESADDTLITTIGGTSRWQATGTLYGSNTSTGGVLQTAASAILPGHTFANDLNTGIGTNAADELSLIAGGIEAKRLLTATLQTTAVTTTEIIAIPVASGEGFGFRINIIGTEDATGDTVFESIFGAIRNQAGTTAIVGSSITDRTDDAGASTWVITVAADDTTDELTVDVAGEAAHTIDWKVSVELLNV